MLAPFIAAETRKASDLSRIVLKLREEELGPMHAETLKSMNLYAVTLLDMGNEEMKRAREIFQSILERRKDKFGLEHPDLIESYINLGVSLNNLAEYTEAETLLRLATTLSQQIVGDQSQSTQIAMNALAACLSNQGKYEEAISTGRIVLASRIASRGPDHHETHGSRYKLSSDLFKVHRYHEAAEQCLCILRYKEQINQELHRFIEDFIPKVERRLEMCMSVLEKEHNDIT